MISDDGSKDDSVALAERVWDLAEVPLRIRRVNPNGGEYRNVNGAFAEMPEHIEWVLIMHADNEPLPGWVSLFAAECARATPALGSVCASWQYVVDGHVLCAGDQSGIERAVTVSANPASIRGTLFQGCWWHNSCAAIRVKAWRSIGGHPQETPLLDFFELLGLKKIVWPRTRKIRIKGDWDTFLRLLSSGFDVRYLPVPLMRYIELSSSVSAGSFAWHGDLIETLQIVRRHQAAMSRIDLVRIHLRVMLQLGKRIGGGLLRGQFGRAWKGMQALPVMFLSLPVTLLRSFDAKAGRMQRIEYGADYSVPER
jgi:glycosyltransferase involved in cell wall biosynthesis